MSTLGMTVATRSVAIVCMAGGIGAIGNAATSTDAPPADRLGFAAEGAIVLGSSAWLLGSSIGTHGGAIAAKAGIAAAALGVAALATAAVASLVPKR